MTTTQKPEFGYAMTKEQFLQDRSLGKLYSVRFSFSSGGGGIMVPKAFGSDGLMVYQGTFEDRHTSRTDHVESFMERKLRKGEVIFSHRCVLNGLEFGPEKPRDEIGTVTFASHHCYFLHMIGPGNPEYEDATQMLTNARQLEATR